MPDIFKALASITAWCLFIISWIIGLSTAVMGTVHGDLFGGEAPSMIYPAMFTVSIVAAVAAVAVMILRKKME